MGQENNIVLGLDFETILPVEYDVLENKLLVLSGKKDSGKERYAKYIVDTLIERLGNVELYILDDLAGKWAEYELKEETAFYSPTSEAAESIVSEIGQRLSKRYEELNSRYIENLDKEAWILFIIESTSAIEEISKNKTIMPIAKDIIGKYGEMKVFVLFTDIPNSNISYNALELMKVIKENKKYIIFDEISNIKLADISPSIAKKYSKQLEKHDAYLIQDGNLKKIKTIC